ncbi:MAG: hypothetical protein AAGA38_09335 [Pseudomonadota bacterium]
MVQRRLLTVDLLRDLELPTRQEYWIADTKVRGFGVRVWASDGTARFNYAVRKSDPSGRSVRRSLNLDALRVLHYDPWNFSFLDRDLASFLPEARHWAQLEIAKITGRIESDEALDAARKADAEYREWVGRYVSELKLTRCVELVFRSAKYRGWTEEYEDRLWRAYWAFDKATKAGDLTIGQLENGVLANKIETAPIGFGNVRLLRSLLRIVAENVHALKGAQRWRLLPSHLDPNASPKEEAAEFLENLDGEDFDAFLEKLRNMDASWQSKLSIELAFLFSTPFSRVLRGRWSQVHEDRWYPYDPDERKYGRYISERIAGRSAECLKLAQDFNKTGSDYWFPAESNPNVPIKNIDRTWNRALRECDWPEMPLGFVSKFFSQAHFWQYRYHRFSRL